MLAAGLLTTLRWSFPNDAAKSDKLIIGAEKWIVSSPCFLRPMTGLIKQNVAWTVNEYCFTKLSDETRMENKTGVPPPRSRLSSGATVKSEKKAWNAKAPNLKDVSEEDAHHESPNPSNYWSWMNSREQKNVSLVVEVKSCIKAMKRLPYLRQNYPVHQCVQPIAATQSSETLSWK